MKDGQDVTRRGFLQTSATASAALMAAQTIGARAYAAGREVIKFGLIGCGGRASGAMADCLNGSPNTVVAAVGDLFEDAAKSGLEKAKKFGDRCLATPETCFWGFDNYKKVVDSGVDMIVTATPPGFRPLHMDYAIRQGKHIFMEKPVCVDPVGYRTVCAAADIAKEKGLAIVAGTQRRHQKGYVETVKRIQDGAIGDVVGLYVYWNQGSLWNRGRRDNWTDVEWQIRNWLYFDWLSGDHIVEQHVHNIDVGLWCKGDVPPVRAYGMGGRQQRTDPAFGHIYDHFAIEYEWADGSRMSSQCRQIPGCDNRVSEFVIGTKGKSNPSGWIDSENGYRHSGKGDPNPYVQEHTDMVASILAGQPLNEGRQVANSCLAAIIGRMSAYSGETIEWKWAAEECDLKLMPDNLEFGPMATPEVAMPDKVSYKKK